MPKCEFIVLVQSVRVVSKFSRPEAFTRPFKEQYKYERLLPMVALVYCSPPRKSVYISAKPLLLVYDMDTVSSNNI